MTAPAQGEWADLLEQATASVVALVEAHPGVDWSVPAPGLDWTMHEVLEHMADDLVYYAGQLVRGRTDGWPPFAVRIEGDHAVDALGDVLTTTSRILGAAVRDASPDALGWHPYGTAGPRDYAAMGVVELLVHGEDLRRGWEASWTPPTSPVEAVLALLFGVDDPGPDPWQRLLSLCGRTGGPSDWRWVNTAT